MSRLESENKELMQKEIKNNLKSKIYEEHFIRKEKKSQKLMEKFENLTIENDNLKKMIECFNSKPPEKMALSNQNSDDPNNQKNSKSLCDFQTNKPPLNTKKKKIFDPINEQNKTFITATAENHIRSHSLDSHVN